MSAVIYSHRRFLISDKEIFQKAHSLNTKKDFSKIKKSMDSLLLLLLYVLTSYTSRVGNI